MVLRFIHTSQENSVFLSQIPLLVLKSLFVLMQTQMDSMKSSLLLFLFSSAYQVQKMLTIQMNIGAYFLVASV